MSSGNVIVLDNTTAGDITFSQKCTAEAFCVMDNSLDALVEAYQEAKVVADAKPAFFPGISISASVNDTKQTIKNDLTQIMENLCTADVSQTNTDNIVYATDSNIGNIGFLQEGSASADCVMQNIGRLTAQLKQDGDITAASGGSFAGISGLIVIIIIVIVIIFAVGKLNKKTRDTGSQNNQRQFQQRPQLTENRTRALIKSMNTSTK